MTVPDEHLQPLAPPTEGTLVSGIVGDSNPQESESDVDIVVFPEQDQSEGSDGSVRAHADKSLPCSIISTGMLSRVHVGFTPSQTQAVKDKRNTTYSPIGKVDLRWHKKEKGKSYPQTFYVVNQATPLVILGAPAFVTGNQSSGNELLPVGLHQQTAGSQSYIRA
ncbi:MAG: hypothetical protein Q9216_004724 [Gyalolechia sp. 2 TL-2023]